MMLRVIVLGLSFSAAYLLSISLLPIMQKGLLNWQKRRIEKVRPVLDRIFINLPLGKLMLMFVFSPVISAFITLMFTKEIFFVLIGAGIGLIAPSLVIKNMEKMRTRKFGNQLVDGLMILSSGLRAGLSLIQTLEALVDEMPAPISQEFGLVLRQNHMGVPIDEALNSLKARIASDEIDLVVTSILVAREAGGDLTEIFNQLVFTIRERNKLLSKIKAMTVQGKLQGFVMGVLPIVFAIFVFSVNKDFFNFMLQDNIGRLLLIYAVVSEAIGVFFIYKLSQVEV